VGIDPEEFFGDVQGAAVLKHGVLRRYLAVFTSKVGSTARDGKVFYLDAYAGPGEYQDGGEGSPAVARATAENLAKTRKPRRRLLREEQGEPREARTVFWAAPPTRTTFWRAKSRRTSMKF
jgi:three-Cys-motif partner protein